METAKKYGFELEIIDDINKGLKKDINVNSKDFIINVDDEKPSSQNSYNEILEDSNDIIPDISEDSNEIIPDISEDYENYEDSNEIIPEILEDSNDIIPEILEDSNDIIPEILEDSNDVGWKNEKDMLKKLRKMEKSMKYIPTTSKRIKIEWKGFQYKSGKSSKSGKKTMNEHKIYFDI